jgi:acetolactate synthase-1/2/3 large subunit
MRVCDWIAEYLWQHGVKNVYGIMGGGAAGLNDGFIKHGKIKYRCFHHEQGAAHAAIGESKLTGRVAVVNPTTGCGGMNCATSVLDAWQDSTPVIFISGNVRLNACSGYINQQRGINIRKYGLQEHHVVDTYKSITKASTFVTDVKDVAYTIQRAFALAYSGRPGPVWIDIPGDIQLAQMPEEYVNYHHTEIPSTTLDEPVNYEDIKQRIAAAERPIVLAGYGIRQSNTVDEFIKFVEHYQIPFVSTFGGRDYTSDDHPLSIGAVGIKGLRGANFAMQNADLLLVLGSSLGGAVIGYDPKQFSPASYKIVVDIDKNELKKGIVEVDENINIDLGEFFGAML